MEWVNEGVGRSFGVVVYKSTRFTGRREETAMDNRWSAWPQPDEMRIPCHGCMRAWLSNYVL